MRIFSIFMCVLCSLVAADIPAPLQAQIDAYSANTVKNVEAFNKATDANREKLVKAITAAKAGAKPEQAEMLEQVMTDLTDGKFDKQFVDMQRYRMTPTAWAPMVTQGLDGKPEVKSREQVLEMSGSYQRERTQFIVGYLAAGTVVGVKYLSSSIRVGESGSVFDADAPGNLCMDLMDPDRPNYVLLAIASPGRTAEVPASFKVTKAGVYKFRLACDFNSRTTGLAAFKVKLGGF